MQKEKKNPMRKRLKKFSSLLLFPSTPTLKTQNKKTLKNFFACLNEVNTFLQQAPSFQTYYSKFPLSRSFLPFNLLRSIKHLCITSSFVSNPLQQSSIKLQATSSSNNSH